MDKEQKNIIAQMKLLKIMVIQIILLAILPIVQILNFNFWVRYLIVIADVFIAIIGLHIAYRRFKQREKEEHGLSKL
jgi:hypothetical protein